MNNILKKKFNSELKYVYSENGTLSIIFQSNENLLGVVGEFNNNLKELEKQFQKHFDNSGRFNHAVSESSFDTWLDGYVKGAPGRKVSIYVEGCLLAFITDYMLRKASNNKIGLEGVMKRMYYHP